ncbi:hypothetical protein EDC01DRAFT_512755 [Geopyxis carbonaria]|nr:hypothetical protein EDC01DRAFT_512755 [Geopyxis carbonaria]
MASTFSRLALRRQALTRGFRATATPNAASAFTMPAMSPTMTEGAITQWKVKEGDEFVAGDVLLEIETDKAQMDVEAQEDGVMAKIMVETGAKAVQVGTRIAVIAEPGDDLATLAMPAEGAAEAQGKKQPEPEAAAPPKKTEAPAASGPKKSYTDRPQHPSPSVMHLLRAHNISDAASIAGTGPKGRLLKGDILAHLGRINASAPAALEKSFSKLAKLDLSNIKIAAAKPKPAAAKPAKPAAPAPPKEAEIATTVSFAEVAKVQQRMHDSIGAFPPLSTFIAKATSQANATLPPRKAAPSPDDLFADLLDLPRAPVRSVGGSFAPVIAPLQPTRTAAPEVDIIDILSGRASPAKAARPSAPTEGMLASGVNRMTLRVPAAEEERARVFLGRVKGLLEQQPGQLVL